MRTNRQAGWRFEWKSRRDCAGFFFGVPH